MPHSEWEKCKVLIIAKTYPTISRKHKEIVCTGGITDEGRLVRLYPLPLKYLLDENRIPLFSWIEVELKKSREDFRIESYKINPESITIVETIKDKGVRQKYLEPLVVNSLEELDNDRKIRNVSLGIIEIGYRKFLWREESDKWAEEKQAILMQYDLLEEKRIIEKIPFKFSLSYLCKNNNACRGHKQSILIWDYYQAFRKFRIRYDGEINALNQINKLLESKNYFDIMNKSKRVYALVGTVKQFHHFGTWIIGGLYFFDKDIQLALI